MQLGLATRISKQEFYRNGGFANTKQYRKMYSGTWRYFWIGAW